MRQVKFKATWDHKPFAEIDGWPAWPTSEGVQPMVGETWEVDVAGVKSGMDKWIRLVRKVEAEPVAGPATIVVVRDSNDMLYSPTNWKVLIDGQPLRKDAPVVDAVRSIKFALPSNDRAKEYANSLFQLEEGRIYVLIFETYNSRNTPRIVSEGGLIRVFAYGDGHGMSWAALFKVSEPSWTVDWNTPSGKYRIVGSGEKYVHKDEERRVEEAPIA